MPPVWDRLIHASKISTSLPIRSPPHFNKRGATSLGDLFIMPSGVTRRERTSQCSTGGLHPVGYSSGRFRPGCRTAILHHIGMKKRRPTGFTAQATRSSTLQVLTAEFYHFPTAQWRNALRLANRLLAYAWDAVPDNHDASHVTSTKYF